MGRKTRGSLFAIAVCFAVALTAIAAPIMPRKTAIPDEMRALAKLKEVQIEYQAIPQPLAHHGLRKEDVQRLVQRRMKQYGFDLVSKSQVPIITVSFRAMEDDTVPKATGYAVFLELRQRVRVHRLDDDVLFLPTATVLAYGLKQNDLVKEGVLERVNFAIDQFLHFADRATHSRQVEKREQREQREKLEKRSSP